MSEGKVRWRLRGKVVEADFAVFDHIKDLESQLSRMYSRSKPRRPSVKEVAGLNALAEEGSK